MAVRPYNANQLVVRQLREFHSEMQKHLDADVLTYVGPIAYGADDDLRDAIEEIENKRLRLFVVLETSGGFAETARRISDTLRDNYKTVDFLVPNYALSAGTILVMSGNAIHMDSYSVLGPIDPQIEAPDGKSLIPALGYCHQYEQFLKKAKRGKISEAEMEILLNFDQAQLYSYYQARDLSLKLLEEWLVKYKFENWSKTETKGQKVTSIMKRQRARQIANKLNDIKLWNSHGMGINMQRLRDILNLKIDDFGKDGKLNPIVRQYHKLMVDYMHKMRFTSAVHTAARFQALITSA
jgi:hypothetical protein